MLKNKYFITLSYLFVILGLLIGTSLLLAPVERRNKVKIYEAKYEGFIEDLVLVDVLDINDPIISEKIQAKDKDGNNLTLYGAKLGNDFGEIELIIALDPNGKVIASKALKVDQTFSQDKLTDLIVNMKDKTIQTPAGNVSGVTIGSKTIQDILNAIEKEHLGKLTELEKIFGLGSKEAKLEDINKDGIISKQNVLKDKEVIGTIYVLETEKTDETGTAKMTVKVNLDKDGKTLSYSIIAYTNTSHDKNLITLDEVLSVLEGK